MSQANRTRTQHYAEKSLKKIQAIKGKETAKDYKSRCDNFPVMVMQAGIAQAVGFMLAKGKENQAYSQYLNDLASVMGEADGTAFHAKIIAVQIPDYRKLTRETLNAAGWFKRFGQAYLSEK